MNPIAFCLLLFTGLPVCGGHITKSFATYVAPMSGPGAQDNATIKVWTPASNVKLPVFMWIMGTFDHFDNTPPYTKNIFDDFAEYMAGKGYIAAIPDYQNQDMCLNICLDAQCPMSLSEKYLGRSTGPIGKIAQPEKNRGLSKAMDVLCALPQADCSLGVAVAGHSQGAFTTVQLATIDSRITAINPWSYGYIDLTAKPDMACVLGTAVDTKISKQKRRMVVGQYDGLNSLDAELDMKGPTAFSSYTCEGDHAPIDCIQSDGSGYYVIAKTEYTDADKEETPPENLAGHPFFNTKDPVGFHTKLVPSFASGTKPWHMHTMFDWLAAAARKTDNATFVV